MYTHTHTQRNISHKKETLLFWTTRIELVVILLSETSQTKTNIIRSWLHVESKKYQKRKQNELIDTENRVLLIIARSQLGDQ